VVILRCREPFAQGGSEPRGTVAIGWFRVLFQATPLGIAPLAITPLEIAPLEIAPLEIAPQFPPVLRTFAQAAGPRRKYPS